MSNEVTDATFDREVLKSPIPVFVDFWAPWCGPCKSMLPIIEELEKEYEGKMKVVKVNVDENNDAPGKYGIMSIPTFLIIKGGEVVDTIVGAKPKDDLVKKFDAALAA